MTIYIVWYKRANECYGIWAIYNNEESAERAVNEIENTFGYMAKITDEEVLD